MLFYFLLDLLYLIQSISCRQKNFLVFIQVNGGGIFFIGTNLATPVLFISCCDLLNCSPKDGSTVSPVLIGRMLLSGVITYQRSYAMVGVNFAG